MPHDHDGEERRALQRKAYGREASLTDAEARRLHELEHALRESARPEAAAPAAERSARTAVRDTGPVDGVRLDGMRAGEVQPPVTRGVVDEENAAAAPVADETETESAADEAAPGIWRTLRSHGKPVAAASAVLLAIGLGAGWALFSPRASDIPLSAEEVERKLELYTAQKFDDGSLRAVARDGDALVWFATKSAPESQSCLTLDVGEQSSINCVTDDEFATFPLNASISVPSDEGGSMGGSSVNATGMLTTAGEVMVAINRWDYDDSMLSQFEGEEKVRAQALIDEGYQPGMSLIGHFRGESVWVADRFTDTGSMERCLIVDVVDASKCAAPDNSGKQAPIRLSSGDADDSPWSLTVEFTGWGMPYLTITEGPTGGSLVVIDTESGDPIEVQAPVDPAG
ncbi:hypothetical protein ACFY5A_09680 [Microbacterium sp. NPDC012755]|uniref:hypothetical protein n=1 Tax=Microbacterium sp. NPDC012755 TaxID=3364184 RepID=UPI0036B4E7D3